MRYEREPYSKVKVYNVGSMRFEFCERISVAEEKERKIKRGNVPCGEAYQMLYYGIQV